MFLGGPMGPIHPVWGSCAGVILQTELAMRGSNGIGKGLCKVCGALAVHVDQKKQCLVALALVLSRRNRRSRAQTSILTTEN